MLTIADMVFEIGKKIFNMPSWLLSTGTISLFLLNFWCTYILLCNIDIMNLYVNPFP